MTATATVTVLVTDDSEIMCELAARMLRGLGFEVVLASNGTQALDLLATSRFDLVLMDCGLPDVDGFAVVRSFREMERRRSGEVRTPIIAMTGETYAECRAACVEAGMDDYLGKPFTAADLRGIVERWIVIPAR